MGILNERLFNWVCMLTYWVRATHKCVSKLTIIGPDNGLSSGRRQANIWTNAGILLIRTLGTNFSEILSETHSFSFKKILLKMSSGKWRPFCLGLNVLSASWIREKAPTCRTVSNHSASDKLCYVLIANYTNATIWVIIEASVMPVFCWHCDGVRIFISDYAHRKLRFIDAKYIVSCYTEGCYDTRRWHQWRPKLTPWRLAVCNALVPNISMFSMGLWHLWDIIDCKTMSI